MSGNPNDNILYEIIKDTIKDSDKILDALIKSLGTKTHDSTDTLS